MAHPTQQPHPRLNLSPNAPNVELTATLYSSGSLTLVERGPRGGYYSTTVPAAEVPRLAAFIAPSDPNRRALELVEQIARFTLTTEIECGQCEGTGTTDAMGHDEECPVCNGTGEIAGEEHGAGEALDALVIRAREIVVEAPCNTPPTRVLVALEGGCVQGAVADRAGVSVIVLDYDTEGADADRVFAIPQDNGGTAEAFVGGHSAVNDAAFIDGAENAKLAADA